MSKFTISFQANTSGEHRVGYRSYVDAPLFYNTINIQVVEPGLQTVDIEVEGNLYCANEGVEFTGYVIAACQGYGDINSDGIPDLALTWQLTMAEQIDPCKKYTIECENVPLKAHPLGLILNDGGAGYGGAPAVVFSGGGAGAGATGTAALGTGNVTGVVGDSLGAGYSELDGSQGPIGLIGLLQTGIVGTLATVNVTFASGAVTIDSIAAGGSGYISSENPVTLDLTDLADGTPPATEEQITLTAGFGFADEVYSVTLTGVGSGYQSIPTVTLAGGTPNADVVAVLEDNCPSIDLDTYKCSDAVIISGDTLYEIDFTDSIYLCVDDITLGGLSSQFVTTEISNCHCETCKEVFVESAGGTGTGTISYQTCWDGEDDDNEGQVRLVTVEIQAAAPAIKLDCIIEDTLTLDQGTCTNPILVISSNPCNNN